MREKIEEALNRVFDGTLIASEVPAIIKALADEGLCIAKALEQHTPHRGDDREFLLWLADRLVLIYGENPGVDFVGKLVSIAQGLPAGQRTPNTRRHAKPWEPAEPAPAE